MQHSWKAGLFRRPSCNLEKECFWQVRGAGLWHTKLSSSASAQFVKSGQIWHSSKWWRRAMPTCERAWGSAWKRRDQPSASLPGWTWTLTPKATQEASMGLSGIVPKEQDEASLLSFINVNDHCDAAKYVTLGSGRN